MKYYIAIVVLFSATAAMGQGVRVRGLGASSCGQYLEMRAEGSKMQNAVLVSWIWGYMAGFNTEVRQPTTRETPDEASTLVYIDRYCRSQPLENVLTAVRALIVELGGKPNLR